jgi:hypothetical protein
MIVTNWRQTHVLTNIWKVLWQLGYRKRVVAAANGELSNGARAWDRERSKQTKAKGSGMCGQRNNERLNDTPPCTSYALLVVPAPGYGPDKREFPVRIPAVTPAALTEVAAVSHGRCQPSCDWRSCVVHEKQVRGWSCKGWSRVELMTRSWTVCLSGQLSFLSWVKADGV